jgi:cystathionine gamma-synthase
MASPFDRYKPATRAAQALGAHDAATRGVTPAIHPSTTYERDAVPGRPPRLYSRDDNPNYEDAEDLLNSLEGGAGCLLFASGMAAGTAVLSALGHGDHVIMPEVIYWGMRKVASDIASAWGITVDYVRNGDSDAIAEKVRTGRTKVIWVETPSNPTLAVTDIAAAAEIAQRSGAALVVDSTFATPVLTRPIELGADIVLHSATKYLNGHSDVIAGALVARQRSALWERIETVRHYGGAVLGPFEAWLLLRGMRTLFLRVRAQSDAALRIARHFEGHPAIKQVLYPGLPSSPGHAVAARQMKGGFGGMLALRLNGEEAFAVRVWGACRLWKSATSLGGVESLIEHRASVESPESPVPRDLLRLSVGIEDPGDLIEDLEEALRASAIA